MNRKLVKELFSGFEVGMTQSGELVGKRVKRRAAGLKEQSLKSGFKEPIISVGKSCRNPKASFVFGLGSIWR